MSDDTTRLLERLAETFPDRPAPLPDLVAAAHAGRRRRTRRNVALAAGTCVLAVAAGLGLQQVLPDDGTRTGRVADSREACDRDAPRTAPSWTPPQGPDYPTNDAGETYGGGSDGKQPDLVAAIGDCGRTGYVRGTELDPPPWVPGAGSTGRRVVPLYESDGTTEIDTYTIGAAEPQPSTEPPTGPGAADLQGEWAATIVGVTDPDGTEQYDTYRDLDLAVRFSGDRIQVDDGCETVETGVEVDGGAFSLTGPFDLVLGGADLACERAAPLPQVIENVRHVTRSGKRTYLHLENFQIIVVLTRP